MATTTIDPDIINAAAAAAEAVADYRTDTDYGYGGEAYEVRSIENWHAVAEAAVKCYVGSQMVAEDGQPPEQIAADRLRSAFGALTAVPCRDNDELRLLAQAEVKVTEALALLEKVRPFI